MPQDKSKLSSILRFYNTLSRRVEDFNSIKKEEVTIYTCGPTVYDRLHIGNWVSYIRWDILVRILRHNGYKIKRVLNITDVGHLVSDADEGEDKLEKGAEREGKTAWEIAQIYSQDFFKGMHELNLSEPTYYAKATEHITEQIELIKKLESQGYTYKTSDGIYFDVTKFPSYGALAKLNLDQQRPGGRVANPEKRQPQDFALWKFSPKGKKRDMEWESPWGKGFPGWHIECSAMAIKYLGESIDIHTGGIDHIPVHHTNEIAQSEAATGKQFAKYWLHNNFLLVEGQKISKSLGNGFTLEDLERRGFSPLDFKMFVLQSHYRSESNFTWENLLSAKTRLHDLQSFADLRWQNIRASTSALDLQKARADIQTALNDDMNTPLALSHLSDVVSRGLEEPAIDIDEFNNFLRFLDEIFGLQLLLGADVTTEQKKLIAQREQFRANQSWQQADEIRQKLAKEGIEIKDTSLGPIWSRVKPGSPNGPS